MSEMDTTAEPANTTLEFWPSLIHGSTSVVLNAEESNIRFMLWASFAEIYNEQIFDLLEVSTLSANRMTRPSTLNLRDGDGRPYICGLREVYVSSAEEAWRLVQIGRENQHIASTRLNRASSRSHSIFTLRLIQVVDVDQPNVARIASLSFCDLAGSERNTAAGGCNERTKEAGNINKSLMMLGRCIETLRENQARRDQSTVARASIIVPFRNSRLTRMFQSFLCGEGRVIMITNVSPCANVFDETLQALKYSALAIQVVVGPSAPQNMRSSCVVTVPAPAADKHKVSLLGKHEAAAATTKAVLQKKRKLDDIKEPALQEEDEDECSSDEADLWNDERQKLLSAIQKLQSALAEERRIKNTLETQIRDEVCEEMRRQLVRIESEYQENVRRREEILEEKYDRKMEIYMEAVKKSCKRRRNSDDEDDFMPSVELHAAEVKLSRYADEVNEMKNRMTEMEKELATAQENVGKLSTERDALAEKLTKSELPASDTLRQEKAQARAECAKLRQNVEDLTNKLKECEHRHEVSCRQLRRDKAQLEQRLNAAEMLNANHDRQPQNAASEFTKNEFESQTARITELEADLKKEREKIIDLEQCMKDAKDVEKTWADQCKGVESVCQEKTFELTKLREKCDLLECNKQETVKTLEEMKEKRAEAEELLQSVRTEMTDKESQLKELTSVSKGLREEINRLTVESDNIRKNLTAELDAKDAECEKLKTEIGDLKQQASTAVDSSQDEITAVQHELDAVQKKLKRAEDEKAAAADLLNSEIAKRTAQQLDENDKLHEKMLEIGRLEKDLEEERGSRRRLEDAVAGYEKKLAESESDLCQEKEKYLTLQTSLATLQNEFSVAKNARKAAEEESAGHMSAVTAYEAKMESAKVELDDLKEQLRNSGDREVSLKQQLSSSSQLIKELQEKDKNLSGELADRDEKLETCHKTINDLTQKMEKERGAFELALTDARSNKGVVEQMKLTITEQEMTMETQDQMLRERDNEAQSLKERLDQVNDQIRQKNTRVRELEKELEKVRKSCECLQKDVRDTTSELQTAERNLAEVTKELESAKQERDKLRSGENDAKSLVKQLYQRDVELSNLRKQLESAQDKMQKHDQEMEKLKNQVHTFEVSKDKELSAWREKRDKVVTQLEKAISEKDAEIESLKATSGLKTGRSKRDKHPSSESVDHKTDVLALQQQVEQLKLAASAKDQTIADMREQNLRLQSQLQHQSDVSDMEDNTRQRNAPRKSRIPTSQRLPLRSADGNADISVGVLADSGVAVDLDETLGTTKRRTRRLHGTQENSQPKPSETVDEHFTRASRSRRMRTTGFVDPVESTISEESRGPSQTRQLRPRHC